VNLLRCTTRSIRNSRCHPINNCPRRWHNRAQGSRLESNAGAWRRRSKRTSRHLILPKPATVDDARQALAPGEALVSVLVTRGGSYVWAIPKTGPVAFAASPLNGAEVSALVGSLRQSLDPGQVALDRLAHFSRQLIASMRNCYCPSRRDGATRKTCSWSPMERWPSCLLRCCRRSGSS